LSAEDFMRKTFELACKGIGKTWPNPLVGAVIIKDGRIIGEGAHLQYGQEHAEVNALKNCSESAQGATVYVNLEPCCHTNKQTPPCAQRLIEEKVAKVVICNLDPNPNVNGKGLELLQASGLTVEHGLLSEEGEKLNEVFFLSQRKKRPFIHLKMATTLDGRIALATGESKWITGQAARDHVHGLRSTHQVVMVGAQTVRKDDPKLNVRIPGFEGVQPFRAIISNSGQLPASSQILTDELKEKTFIYSSIEEAMDDLYQKKLINVFLEGGPTLATGFLAKGLIDRVSLYLNPSFLGHGLSVLGDFNLNQLAQRPTLKEVQSSWFGEDLYLTGRLT
jgi:diaminohydroxyphosphoribosylaminopyrimidine deaminase / 5-amino-6-(5-phosphoribosylamino)uracil reductase